MLVKRSTLLILYRNTSSTCLSDTGVRGPSFLYYCKYTNVGLYIDIYYLHL